MNGFCCHPESAAADEGSAFPKRLKKADSSLTLRMTSNGRHEIGAERNGCPVSPYFKEGKDGSKVRK
jgi:hypothetical protein